MLRAQLVVLWVFFGTAPAWAAVTSSSLRCSETRTPLQRGIGLKRRYADTWLRGGAGEGGVLRLFVKGSRVKEIKVGMCYERVELLLERKKLLRTESIKLVKYVHFSFRRCESLSIVHCLKAVTMVWVTRPPFHWLFVMQCIFTMVEVGYTPRLR